MVIFRWSKELETGIELVDRQHRQIVETANSFFIRRKCGKEQSAVAECLRFLEQYILYHFQTEEAFQVECSYPRYRAHQAMHKALSTNVKFFTVQLEDTNYAQADIERFYAFLTGWIAEHLMSEDAQFARHYRQYKAGRAGAGAT